MIIMADRYLHFYPNKRKAHKAWLGALYNLCSRVAAGVIAGLIATTLTPNMTNTPPQNPAGAAAAITGAIAN